MLAYVDLLDEAVQLTPDVQEIKKASSLLKALVARLQKTAALHEVGDVTEKFVRFWLEIAANSMAIIGGNAKVRDEITQGTQKLLSKDPKHTLLRAVVTARQRVMHGIDMLGQCSSDAILTKLEDGDPFQSLLRMTAPEAVLSELNSEAFDDVLATRCAQLSVTLRKLSADATDHMKGMGNHGESCWKSTIPMDNDDLKVVLEQQEQTIFRLSGKTMKSLATQFEEACVWGLESGVLRFLGFKVKFLLTIQNGSKFQTVVVVMALLNCCFKKYFGVLDTWYCGTPGSCPICPISSYPIRPILFGFSTQVSTEVETFIGLFGEQASTDSCQEAFRDLRESMAAAFDPLRDVKVVCMEVMIGKALANHLQAVEKDDKKAQSDAGGVMAAQISNISKGTWKLDNAMFEPTLLKLAMSHQSI